MHPDAPSIHPHRSTNSPQPIWAILDARTTKATGTIIHAVHTMMMVTG